MSFTASTSDFHYSILKIKQDGFDKATSYTYDESAIYHNLTTMFNTKLTKNSTFKVCYKANVEMTIYPTRFQY